MAQKTYTIVIKVNGKTVESMPGATIKFGGFTREPVVVNGRAGQHFIEKPEPGGCSFKIAHGADTDIDEVRNWKDVTLQGYCDSGGVYQCAGAFTMNSIELADGDGGLSVEMGGPPWEEI
jgi:hypothetical protein